MPWHRLDCSAPRPRCCCGHGRGPFPPLAPVGVCGPADQPPCRAHAEVVRSAGIRRTADTEECGDALARPPGRQCGHRVMTSNRSDAAETPHARTCVHRGSTGRSNSARIETRLQPRCLRLIRIVGIGSISRTCERMRSYARMSNAPRAPGPDTVRRELPPTTALLTGAHTCIPDPFPWRLRLSPSAGWGSLSVRQRQNPNSTRWTASQERRMLLTATSIIDHTTRIRLALASRMELQGCAERTQGLSVA